MEKNALLGTLIKEDNSVWRIFLSSITLTKGCLTEINGKKVTRLVFREWPTIQLLNGIVDGTIEQIAESEDVIIPESEMRPDIRELYVARKSYVTEVANLIAPNYDLILSRNVRPGFRKMYEKYGYCQASALKYIRIYLQSGMKYCSLLDGRSTRTDNRNKAGEMTGKTGPKCNDTSIQGKILNGEDIEHIQWGIELYMSSSTATIEYSYMKTLLQFYVNEEGVLKDMYPSIRQFRYQLSKSISSEEIAKAKMEKNEFENNSRLLYSTPKNDALRPGQILEADECEMDVLVVSSANRRQIIGRPIVYFLVDLYSHVIVGMSVHLHNNSMAGITSAILNLFENKQDYCRRFDIRLSNPDLWPSCFVPDEIRSDQGSEYGSDQFERICHALNIRRSLAPPAMGSYKGAVERSFGSMMSLLRPELEDRGLIMKTHDSNHYKTAMYTMRDITRLCINFVINHNNMVIDKMKISREMSMNGVRKVPVDIWKWGIEHRGQPTRLVTNTNLAETIYEILTPLTARLGRDCVTVKGLKYLPVDDNDLKARLLKLSLKGKSETMEVRIDPRDVNSIYYLKNGHIARMNLVDDKVGNDWNDMTWCEVLAEQTIIRDQDRAGQKEKLALKCIELSNVETILSETKPSEFKTQKTEITDSRMQERNLIDRKDCIADKIAGSGTDEAEDAKDDRTEGVKAEPSDTVPSEEKKSEASAPEETDNDTNNGKDSGAFDLSNRDAFINAIKQTGSFDF